MNEVLLQLCALTVGLVPGCALSQPPPDPCDVPLVVTRFDPASRKVELVRDLGVQDVKAQLGTSFATVESISVDGGPKRIALILDASQSIPPNEWKLETEMAGTLARYGRPEDRFFVSIVGSDSPTSGPLSSDEATKLLGKLVLSRPGSARSGERIYDALFEAARQMSPAKFGDALFLFGHPEDSGSKVGPDQAADLILKSRLRFYGLSFSDPLTGKLPPGFNPNKPLPANLGPPKLAQISASTGYFFSFHSTASLNYPGQTRLLEGFLGDLFAGIAEPYRITLPLSNVPDRTKLSILVANMKDRDIDQRDIHFPRLIYPCTGAATSSGVN